MVIKMHAIGSGFAANEDAHRTLAVLVRVDLYSRTSDDSMTTVSVIALRTNTRVALYSGRDFC